MLSFTRSMAILAFGLLGASPVLAAEHTYPGAMCVRTTAGANAGGLPKVDDKAQLVNQSSTSDLTVVCPVVGPYNDLSGAAPNNKAQVFVKDMHLRENVCCSARANNVGIVSFGAVTCSSGADEGNGGNGSYQTLSMTTPSVPFTFTSRYFHCTVPEIFNGHVSAIRLYRY